MAAADADPANYRTAPILAGLTKVFTAPLSACDACQRVSSEGAVVTGTSAVTPKLRDCIATGRLAGLAPAQVVPFLSENLHLRVVTVNQQRILPTIVPGLRVRVNSTMSIVQDGILVDWHPREHPEVTDIWPDRERGTKVSHQHTQSCRPKL